MTHPRLALAFVMLLGASAAPAADVTPEARRLLDDMARSYKALPSYADKGEVTLTYDAKVGQPAAKQTVPSRVALARPNRVAIDAGIVRIISDGKTLRTITPPFSMYRDVPATAKLGINDFADGPLGAVQFSGPQGQPLSIVLSFLLADDPVKSLVDDALSIKATLGVKRDDSTRNQLVYEPQVGPTLTLWVDPATNLLDRIDVALKGKDGSEPLIPNSPVAIESLVWTSGPVETKAVPDSAFALVKPEGFAEIAKLEKDVAKKKAEHELIDKPAPDVTFNILDGPGKIRRVKKADLVGNVVLLDFWATWCGPCMSEMPDIQKLIADFAAAKKPVVVIAVNLDQLDDADPDEIRTLIEKTLKEKSLDLQVAPVGKIAVDSSQTVARAYKVSAIPQLVIIDAEGVVRHVHIGVTAKDTLIEEIDALIPPSKKP
jgi:thiol-disulfide isomerase/thioredoxin